MITDEQIDHIIRSLRNDLKSITSGNILTNSYRVLDALSKVNFDPTRVYFVTSDKNRNLATELYTAGANVFIASLDKVAREFKRHFDGLIFDIDGVSCETLDLLCEVITHGAKEGCALCLISSCDGIGSKAIEKINETVENINVAHNSDASYERKLRLYLHTISLPFAVTPWVSPEKVSNLAILELPETLSPPVEGGETPFFGTRNHATLSFVARYISTACVKTRSYPIPFAFFYISDGKSSTGIVYIATVYRGPAVIDQKRYQDKCLNKITNRIPYFFTINNHGLSKGLPKLATINATNEKALLVAPFLSKVKLGKPIDILAEDAWYEKLKKESEGSAESDRIIEIINEVKAWVTENGGRGKVSHSDLVVKMNSYPELVNFVKSIDGEKI